MNRRESPTKDKYWKNKSGDIPKVVDINSTDDKLNVDKWLLIVEAL